MHASGWGGKTYCGKPAAGNDSVGFWTKVDCAACCQVGAQRGEKAAKERLAQLQAQDPDSLTNRIAETQAGAVGGGGFIGSEKLERSEYWDD